MPFKEKYEDVIDNLLDGASGEEEIKYLKDVGIIPDDEEDYDYEQ